ncbi:MFS transporter [Marinoscillum furvescens]|uniref:Putative MFS family arabinose efflux permease n=1 Tax=Marinoscillum furvescens DSM 4134 TaxID=1122208 RepID=A0A3D9L4A7_MARFU|nr:MFS transporter [Marinoscillum furvescens]RED99767.1 putative MFS family arabinose efflux permease [Marinoscillum furvescens DSM 4134]
MNYLQLLRKYPYKLTYGALHYFFSSIGQTFLISVSVPFILSDLSLSSGAFSNSYAIATIASAFTLPLIGGWVDRANLKHLSLVGGIGLIMACAVMFSADRLMLLIPGLFLLRFFGQGGMILIGSTATAKFFHEQRGKALSVVGLGLAIAETFTPMVLIFIINDFGWRMSWIALAAVVLLIFIPLTRLLIKTDTAIPQTAPEQSKTTDFTRRQVLRDPKFYLLLPAFMFLPFFITGIFIHQNLLAAAKGWSMDWMAFCFVGYGIAKVLTSFLGGALVDRFSAQKVFTFYLLPVALGLALLLFADHKLAAMLYMILLGMTASLGSLTGVALWAELYGVKNLGAIKSMTTTFMVVATAIGPIVIGYGLQGSTNTTLLVAIFSILLIILVSFFVIKSSNFNTKTT